MSEITAVPLRPIAKGSLTRLWLGVGVAVVAAAGLAWAGTAKQVKTASFCPASVFKGAKGPVARLAGGLAVQTLTAGAGAKPNPNDIVLINYKGTLTNGTAFDGADRVPLELANVVPGFRDGLVAMQKGGKYKLCIPPALGYGEKAAGPIPPNSTLLFEIDLIDFKTLAEVQAAQAQYQQQQQLQQQAPASAPAPQ